MSTTKVWYITGASKGMGRAITKQLLSKGHSVAATSRTADALEQFEEYGDRFLALEVDLKSERSIALSLKKTIEKFGRADVIVNNAGYGLGGALEEITSEEMAENFEVNFFAAVRVIQNALPYLREQRSGHIINISSIAGFAPGLGWPVYCAAKSALSGLSEALANDLKPLGLHVTNVLPGWFRTNFAKPDSIAYNKNQMQEYGYLREYHEKMNSMDGMQLGNPDQIADVFLQLAASQNPPVNLFLGSDSFNRAKNKIEQLNQEMSDWKTLSVSTDFQY
ncbi:SDR family NAD(P)-dependent oxidoreductase [Flavobacterium ginsenosidimutans]|uniref:SDR family NAD(P)-dependent oxidoreductase n=1 Tax=Flavobacterium ginsenosidimutans TaxID=687844 RepID=A0ABZ2Q3V2_9FLAO|nr:SDR family NAD(P)-dependent oxidoreductase [Flavobacterium ginsenosidimutans]KAF2328034.1 SDR family NAD(P)-dependent oxidoreductase [Flavobacterium ginsenosidimutans]